LIKSICDWADGEKNDKAQPFASFTATSLAKYVLSKLDVLHPLINSNNQNLENNQDNQNNLTHQPYQNPAKALKQLIKVENSSSISGVVQVSGSIHNSTINVHVDNRVHKDDQRSKTSQNKKLNNLPERNRFFTGRADILNQLSDLIKSNKQVAIKQALSGMGGIGKTQTAIEFCHLHINDYQTILWVNAETEASFNNSYYSLVDLLNLAPKSGDGTSYQALKVDEVISLVKRWLANNSNWLIVLDNLEDPNLIKDYLPPNHQGHILITTCSQSLKGQAAILQLKKMSIETGTLFLLKRASLIPIGTSSLDDLKLDNKFDDKLIDKLITDAQKIVQAMDGLPLALEQAGAYIQESACSLSDYLKSYQDIRNTVSVLDNEGEDANDHKSVYATFKLNFDVVKEKSMAAAKLLEVCSFLDSDLIPEEIFTSAGNFLGDELAKLQDNNYEFNNCIKILLNYSLIERDTNNESLSIHRLVQIVIRDLITEDNKKLLLDSLAKTLNSLCPDDSNNPNTWPLYQRLLPSVTNLSDFSNLYQSNAIEATDLFHQFGIYCQIQALYNQSLQLYFSSLNISQNFFNNNDIKTACILNDIGETYRHQEKYQQALEYYQKALSIIKFVLGEKNISMSSIINNIGIVYANQGYYIKALQHYRKSLSITQAALGKFCLHDARTFNNIGELCRQRKKYTQALRYYKKSLHIYKLLLKDEEPLTADIYNNLAITYDLQGNTENALKYYNEAIQIYKLSFREFHPSIARTFNNMGILYLKQEKYEEALQYILPAFDTFKLLLGENHLNTIKTFKNLCLSFLRQKNSSYFLLVTLKLLQVLDKLLKTDDFGFIQVLEDTLTQHELKLIQLKEAPEFQKFLLIFEKLILNNYRYLIEVLYFYHELLLNLNLITEANICLEHINFIETKIFTTTCT
ncbi:MAG: tetratricopeptide repeat protein, partial [Blastocatellia bacterium]